MWERGQCLGYVYFVCAVLLIALAPPPPNFICSVKADQCLEYTYLLYSVFISSHYEYLRIRCCQTQTVCLRGAPRCRRAGESCTHTYTECGVPFWHGPSHINILRSIYISRGAVPCCHRPHTQTSRSFVTSFRPVPLLSRAPAVPLIRLTPRGQEHPQPSYITHEQWCLATQKVNLRYETPNLRRPVSITAVSQTAPLRGSRYDRSRTNITSATLNGTSQIPSKLRGTCLGKTAISNYIIHHCQGKTAVPNSIMKNCQGKTAIPIPNLSISIPALISQSKARQ